MSLSETLSILMHPIVEEVRTRPYPSARASSDQKGGPSHTAVAHGMLETPWTLAPHTRTRAAQHLLSTMRPTPGLALQGLWRCDLRLARAQTIKKQEAGWNGKTRGEAHT